MNFKKVEFTEIMSDIVVTRMCDEGKVRQRWSKHAILQLVRGINSRKLLCRMMASVSNDSLYSCWGSREMPAIPAFRREIEVEQS